MFKNLQNYESILKKLEEDFYHKHSLFFITAAELEFYFSDDKQQKHNEIIEVIYTKCHENKIPIEKIISEQGKNQYEIIFPTFRYATDTATAITKTKNIVTEIAQEYNTETFFLPLPFSEQPASGLHIHVSIHNDRMKNVFAKSLEEGETDYMIYSVNGLCASMAESMIFFAPEKQDYLRFTKYTDNIINSTVPLNICWGGNNRTTAIRIPSSTFNPNERNLEHRVPCPNANPYQVLCAIIIGINHGIDNKITEHNKIFGNAFDKQYNLPLLPKTLKEAKKAYKKGKIIKKYI